MTLHAMDLGHEKAFPLGIHPPDGRFEEFGSEDNLPIHLAVIGDSTAVGIGASSLECTYPWLLAHHLGDRFRVRLDVIGRSGARMANVTHDLVDQAAALNPDLAIIGIGANDVTHLTPLRRFAADLRTSICRLKDGGTVVLVALGPRFDAPVLPQPLRALAQRRARDLNRTIRSTAELQGVKVLDLPRGIGKSFALDRSLYCADGFHPSDRGYALWAEAMKKEVMEAALARAGRA